MTDLLTAAKAALEALELVSMHGYSGFWENQNGKPAIDNLRTAIAEAEKAEPVTWIIDGQEYAPCYITDGTEKFLVYNGKLMCKYLNSLHPLPTTPPGYKLIAREPTEEMLDVVTANHKKHPTVPDRWKGNMTRIFRAMWDAAPEVKPFEQRIDK